MTRYLVFSLAAAVFVSALAIVMARHESRKLFVELQALERQQDTLNEEWGRLQLEQATWAAHNRVEDLARIRLEMVVPDKKAVVLVRH
jgi:cell division protein FtsL